MARKELTNQVIFITGASAGIGRATALACAQSGMDVIATARRLDRLEALVKEIESLGRRGLAIPCDVADEQAVVDAINKGRDHFGRLDVVMANAGYGLERPVERLDDETIRRIFEVNFFGTMSVIRAAVPIFRTQKSGHILITSSCVSRFTLPYLGAYTATKAAQTQIARSLRLELAPDGINVSVIHPITTRTEFFDVAADHSGQPREGVPRHAPKMFVQPASRVADAVVRCLRKPVPEVWTSVIVRLVCGAMVAFPRFQDFCLRNEAKRRRVNWFPDPEP